MDSILKVLLICCESLMDFKNILKVIQSLIKALIEMRILIIHEEFILKVGFKKTIIFFRF